MTVKRNYTAKFDKSKNNHGNRNGKQSFCDIAVCCDCDLNVTNAILSREEISGINIQLTGEKMKAVIFDFNGTMIFDTKMNEVSWREFIKKYTNRVAADEEMIKYVHGQPNTNIIRHYIDKELTDEEVAAYSEEKEVLYRALCQREKELFKLVKGLEPLLDRLKGRGIPFTIATAACKNNVEFYFEQFGLSRWFSIDKIVYDDGTLPGKPEPDVYLRACKILNMEPKNCIVVEDSLAGLMAAERAGVGRIIAMVSTLDISTIQNQSMADAFIEDFDGFEKVAGLEE